MYIFYIFCWGLFYRSVGILYLKQIFLLHNSMSSKYPSVRSLLIMFLLIISIHCFLGFLLLFLPSAFYSSIIVRFLPLFILFKCPNNSIRLSSINLIVLYCAFKISLIFVFLILFFLGFLVDFDQKFLSVASNVFAWCLPNVQVCAPYKKTT